MQPKFHLTAGQTLLQPTRLMYWDQEDSRAGRISTQGGSIDFQLFLLHFCPCHGNALVSGYATGLEE